jgi:glycosyltransferase involved in cell wall biosynthesis
VTQGADFITPVRLLTHGSEDVSLGGPSVRVPRTAQVLRARGVPAQAGVYTGPADISQQIVHLFNAWTPDTALLALKQLKAAGKTVVFSPIYLDLGSYGFWYDQLPQMPLEDLDAHARHSATALAHLEGRARRGEAMPGYHAMLSHMIALADHVIFLSQSERDALAALGTPVEDDRVSLVPNPVDAHVWQAGDADLFSNSYLKGLGGPSEYVISVGRIEERKNQLLLARALRDLPVRLVLVGHPGNPDYLARVRAEAGPDLLIVDRLPPGGEMLRSAVAGARVFALPSWAEGASLAALEAAAMGARMVLSDRSSEQAYFGDLAQYCDVADPRSIAQAVRQCLDTPQYAADVRAQALRDLVARDYTWDAHVTRTQQAYAKAAKAGPRLLPASFATPAAPARVRDQLVFDITTLANDTHNSEAARTQDALVRALRAQNWNVRFTCWHDNLARFIEVPTAFASGRSAFRYRVGFDTQPPPPAVQLDAGSTVVIAGDAWAQNAGYVDGLEDLKVVSGCSLITLTDDLSALTSSYWYEGGYAASFQRNFYRLAQLSDHFTVPSDWSAQSLHRSLSRQLEHVPPITALPFGDAELCLSCDDATPEAIVLEGRRYVLAAGDLHPAQNYDMLLRVWARLAQTGDPHVPPAHLVLAGKVTPQGLDLARRIAQDPLLAGRVHIRDNISARDLGVLYQNCLFSVCPTHALHRDTVVRTALAHGKLCLASAIGAASEAAGQIPRAVVRIDPEDFIEWHRQITHYLHRDTERDQIEAALRKDYDPVPWAQTALALHHVVKAARSARHSSPLYPGQRATTSASGAPLQPAFGAGWHPRGSGPRWSCAATAQVMVNLGHLRATAADGQMDLLLHLEAAGEAGQTRTLVIDAGGQTLFRGPIPVGNDPCDILVAVPDTVLDEQGCITLECRASLSPAASVQNDNSELGQGGIGLHAVVALDRTLNNPLYAVQAPANWSSGQASLAFFLEDAAQRAALRVSAEFSSAWGLGTPAGRLDLALPVLPGAPAQSLEIVLRPVATVAHPVTVEILWNGRTLGRETYDHDRTVQITLPLSATDMGQQGPQILSLCSDSLLQPIDLDVGPTRCLAGVGLFEVKLAPEEPVS